jgi:transcriptional regulator with XRE-family HTH domain
MPKNKPLRQVVAENAREARKKKKLSQPDVAKAAKRHGLDIDQSTVSRMERSSHPSSIDHIEALAKGLLIEPWQLLMPAGIDEKFLVILKAWAQSGEQGRKLLLLAASGAVDRDAGEAASSVGLTHTR